MLRLHLVLALPVLMLLNSCGPSEPGVHIEDPKAYLVDMLREIEPTSWWAEYANYSEDFLNEVVDSFIKSQPTELPHDSKKLDRMKMRLEGRYASMMVTDPYRDHIMQEAERRFQNPPMAKVGKNDHVALLDFHLLPGEWASAGRGSEVIKFSPAMVGLGEMDHDVFVSALNKVAANFPEVPTYQIRAKYYSGASPHKITIQVSRNGHIVKREGVHEAFTVEKVDWENLLAGEIRLDSLEWDHPMESYPGPGFSFVHHDPLPMGPPTSH